MLLLFYDSLAHFLMGYLLFVGIICVPLLRDSNQTKGLLRMVPNELELELLRQAFAVINNHG